MIRRKDDILAAFATLPAEHQATLSLVLIQTVMNGEWGDWLRGTLALRFLAQSEPFYTILRTEFDQAGLSPEQMDSLTNEDLANIARMVSDHLLTDAFWDEVRYIAENRLYEKHKDEKTDNL